MYVSDATREGREDDGGWRGESLASRGSETFVGYSKFCVLCCVVLLLRHLDVGVEIVIRGLFERERNGIVIDRADFQVPSFHGLPGKTKWKAAFASSGATS